MQYKYTVYGKEKHISTGIHPISIHTCWIGAVFSFFIARKYFTDLYIAYAGSKV